MQPRRSAIGASRAGDPDLHTHVVVANLVRAGDGRWSALDGRRLYAHAKTAGYLYEARLRAQLTRELGVEWTPVRNGIADLVGVPSSVLQAFSRRRAQIDAELDRHGHSRARASEVATLETRRRKDHDIAPEALEREWHQRSEALGFTLERAQGVIGRDRSRALDGSDARACARRAGRRAGAHAAALDIHPAGCDPGVERSPAGARAGRRGAAGAARRPLPRDAGCRAACRP